MVHISENIFFYAVFLYNLKCVVWWLNC